MLLKYDDISYFFQLSSIYPVEENVTFFVVVNAIGPGRYSKVVGKITVL